ncbi:hypothetical protein MRB53_016637 [Persea americana]|uniref:Uncharacterized protein n=1 Tax=Persea americana TaxID=3435 RepID=A0ACC2M397_PERAE|nr:hypothetical protein MRB53_016637 [Persea americana]
MPPKTRKGEGSSKDPSRPPATSKKLQPQPVPRQRRSRGRSGAASIEEFVVTQSGSSMREVTAPPQGVPPPEQPHQSKEHIRRSEKSFTKQGEASTLAKSQSHHQVNPYDDDEPLMEDIRAQNLVIQEKDELIRQLRQQLRERKRAPSPPPRHNQAPPSTEQDLWHVLNNNRRDRVYDEGLSSSHLNEGSKKQHQKPEDESDLKEWLDH